MTNVFQSFIIISVNNKNKRKEVFKMYKVRAQVKGLGERTRVFYMTNNLQDAKVYEEKLKQDNTIILTIITQVNK